MHRSFIVVLSAIALSMLTLITIFGATQSQASSGMAISAVASPDSVSIGGTVIYTVEVTSTSGVNPGKPVIKVLLPAGFTYQPGSSTANGVPIADPEIIAGTLKWRGASWVKDLAGGLGGANTMLQDYMTAGNTAKHLDWTKALGGNGGYVKQLLYPITESTTGPRQEWIDFVNAAYDHGLTPILRLQGTYSGANAYWVKPQQDANGTYSTIAAAYKRVVQGLPRRSGCQLFVEIWNEPNLDAEWSGQPNPFEYGRFFLDVSRAIRSLGYSQVKILNAGMGPDTADYPTFLDTMLSAYPELLTDNAGKPAFDYWASHTYPQNHPPQYNYHNGSPYTNSAIDSYWLQLNILGKHGLAVGTPQHPGSVKVVITEVGQDLGNNVYGFEGYPAINETNRADYMKRAFRDYWSQWPEVLAVAPFELSDPSGTWAVWDWVYPGSGTNPDGSPVQVHPQYSAVKSLPKGRFTLTLTFTAHTGALRGTFPITPWVVVNGTKAAQATNTAPVTVEGTGVAPASSQVLTGKLKSGTTRSLIAKDGDELAIASVGSGTAWRAVFTATYQLPVEADLAAGIAVDYAGRSSLAATAHTLFAYNWKSSAWVKLGTFNAGTTSKQKAYWLPGNLADFVDPDGQVEIRVSTSNSSSFRVSADMLQLVTSP